MYSPYRDRTHGRPPEGLHGAQFVVCSQNHDQVGNRARGERLGHLVSSGRARIAGALLLTSPFVPMLFQGEEWGASTPFLYVTDHDDPDLARAVSEGRRREFARFGWDPDDVPDPQEPASFERSRLRWHEVGEPARADLLDWHRTLVALRRERPGLATGSLDDVEVAFDEDERWLVVERLGAAVAVAVNLGGVERAVPVTAGEVLLASGVADAAGDGSLVLSPDGVAVIGRG